MSNSEKVSIEDLSSLHKHRTETPNIIFEYDLDPYEGWLYMCFKKIAGDKGACFSSIKYLEKLSNIKETKIRACKKSLVAKKLIIVTQRFKDDGSRTTDLIQIIDLWPKNFMNFQKKISGSLNETVVSREMRMGGSGNIDKEDPIKKEPLKKNTIVAPQQNKISFSWKLKEFTGITEKQIATWQKDFSVIDVMIEIEKAKEWVIYHPSKNKNRKNWNKFFEEVWFKNEVERVNYKSHMNTQPNANKAIYDRLKPIYDRYKYWFEHSPDLEVLNFGCLVLVEDGYYKSGFVDGKYHLDYDNFINLLKEDYVKSEGSLKLILNGGKL